MLIISTHCYNTTTRRRGKNLANDSSCRRHWEEQKKEFNNKNCRKHNQKANNVSNIRFFFFTWKNATFEKVLGYSNKKPHSMQRNLKSIAQILISNCFYFDLKFIFSVATEKKHNRLPGERIVETLIRGMHSLFSFSQWSQNVCVHYVRCCSKLSFSFRM